MRKSPAIDTMPEFEPLTIESSNFMLAAKSHRAQGEVFEAAVAWVRAGRKLAELGSKLLNEQYVYEAAQDILYAAACFLEAGDYRPAQEQLNRFSNFPELAELLSSDEYMSVEHVRISDWSKKSRRMFDKAFREMRDQMLTSHDAHRLRQSWIDQTLSSMPGVPEFHFFNARKHAHAASKRGGEASRTRVIESYRWCVRLCPESLGTQILLIWELLEGRRWDEAISVSDEAVRRFPDNAYAHSYAGWSRFLYVATAQGPKSLLPEALEHKKQAVGLGAQMTEYELVTEYFCLAACLSRLGRQDEAEKVLRKGMKEHPTAAGDVLMLLLRTPRAQRARVSVETARSLMGRVTRDAAERESMMAHAA